MPQFFILLLVMLFPSLSFAASFDCSDPGNPLKKMICGDPQVSKNDGELRASYFKALKESPNAVFIMRRQHEWQVNVRDLCKDVACLKNAYSSRIAQLASDRNVVIQSEPNATAASTAHAQTDASALMPLNPQELKAVTQEIAAIANTHVWLSESLGLEDSFVVHEATPYVLTGCLKCPNS
jgi:uncharacterized protein